MPLYEYECDSCHHRFEVIQRFSDPPIAICPKCGAQVQKLPSAPAIQFKGTGWYVTDYAKKSGSDSDKHGTDSSKSSSENESKTSTPPAGDKKGAADKSSTDKGSPDKASTDKASTNKSSSSTESSSASSTGSSSGSSEKQS